MALANGKVIEVEVSDTTMPPWFQPVTFTAQLKIVCRVNDFNDHYVAAALATSDTSGTLGQCLISHQVNSNGAESFTYMGAFK